MSMPIEEAIKRIRNHMEVHRIGQYPHIHIGEALTMAIDALQEKAEREDPKPLTIDELIQMQDQPVWVKYLEEPEQGKWGIVEAASEIAGNKYLFLRGVYGYFMYEEGVVAYRHKPKEG